LSIRFVEELSDQDAEGRSLKITSPANPSSTGPGLGAEKAPIEVRDGRVTTSTKLSMDDPFAKV